MCGSSERGEGPPPENSSMYWYYLKINLKPTAPTPLCTPATAEAYWSQGFRQFQAQSQPELLPYSQRHSTSRPFSVLSRCTHRTLWQKTVTIHCWPVVRMILTSNAMTHVAGPKCIRDRLGDASHTRFQAAECELLTWCCVLCLQYGQRKTSGNDAAPPSLSPPWPHGSRRFSWPNKTEQTSRYCHWRDWLVHGSI